MGRYVDIDIVVGSKKVRANIFVYMLAVSFVMALAVAIIWGSGSVSSSYAVSGSMPEALKKARYVIHAGGEIEVDGQTYSYTNSYEALSNCYDNGNRFCEIDLMTLDDGRIVCSHDEETIAEYEGILTLMSLEDLVDFIRAHKDLVIITDVKDDNVGVCKIFRDQYPDVCGNLIIQIYHKDEYEPIRKLGFSNIIYTLYDEDDADMDPGILTGFISKHPLTGITFWESFPDEYGPSYEALRDSGVPMFVHTINDMEEMKRFADMGVTGIYTDVTNKDRQYF